MSRRAKLEPIKLEGRPSPWMLSIPPSLADYDNPNFLWFKARYEHFIYIDRVVVSEDFRGHHLATRLYADLRTEAIARGIPRLVCEIHIDPPNPVSLRFHEKQGFTEVGQQSIEDPYTGDRKKLCPCR